MKMLSILYQELEEEEKLEKESNKIKYKSPVVMHEQPNIQLEMIKNMYSPIE